ncbi:MAG: hypothetical protein AAB262_00065 [Elusimicrobiota bacterium]
MSYLNEYQQEYVDSLSKIPLTERCWCGWGRLGDCQGGGDCDLNYPGKTRADYLAAACAECFTLPPIHRIKCSLRVEVVVTPPVAVEPEPVPELEIEPPEAPSHPTPAWMLS